MIERGLKGHSVKYLKEWEGIVNRVAKSEIGEKVINPRHACARVTVLGLSFRHSVRPSVTTFSATTRNKPAKE